MKRLWILSLVPPIKFGRYLSASFLSGLIFVWVYSAGVAEVGKGVFTWPIALYFCVTVAYIVAVFHLIVERTEKALDALAPHLLMDAEQLAQARLSISSKSSLWIACNALAAVFMWLIQSWFLASGWFGMMTMITSDVAQFTGATVPLVVWLVTTCAVHALVDNARLFRRLTRYVEVDVLDVRSLMPFGRMAVSSTLVVIGAMATLGIMWIGAEVDPFTTIVPLIPLAFALLFSFLGPLWPIHNALKQAKAREVDVAQVQINALREQGAGPQELGPLLAYRRELVAVHEWPIDVGTLSRFGLYMILVPLTWIGAALIENVVDLFVT